LLVLGTITIPIVLIFAVLILVSYPGCLSGGVLLIVITLMIFGTLNYWSFSICIFIKEQLSRKLVKFLVFTSLFSIANLISFYITKISINFIGIYPSKISNTCREEYISGSYGSRFSKEWVVSTRNNIEKSLNLSRFVAAQNVKKSGGM
jgi:hypothetical protein